MSEPASDEDVLGKLDALMKRHQPASNADFPVLTDIVDAPELDLDAIPMLTEEVEHLPEPSVAEAEAPAADLPEPTPELDPAPEIELPALEFDIPPDVQYVMLEATQPTEATAPAPIQVEPLPPAPVQVEPVPVQQALSEETIQHIASIIKDDVARVLDSQLQQALAQQLQSSLHVALDKALSSMLDQFTTTIEEVVLASIADELQKQLAPFKRPAPPKS